MKKVDKILIVIVSFLMIFTIYKQYFVSKTNAKAKYSWLPNNKLSIGKIVVGKDTLFNCKIKNDSTTTLFIDNVYVSCGCTKFELEKNVVKPFDSVRILITLNAKEKGKNFTYVRLKANTKNNSDTLYIFYEGI
jgi:hypothetical protein